MLRAASSRAIVDMNKAASFPWESLSFAPLRRGPSCARMLHCVHRSEPHLEESL